MLISDSRLSISLGVSIVLDIVLIATAARVSWTTRPVSKPSEAESPAEFPLSNERIGKWG